LVKSYIDVSEEKEKRATEDKDARAKKDDSGLSR
jgi:hypothetical protein